MKARAGSLALVAAGAAAAVALGAGCRRPAERGEGTSAPTTQAAKVERPRAPFAFPGDAELASAPNADEIRRGRDLANRTFELMPKNVGAELHCTSCHLEGGTKPNAGPWVGVASVYPLYRARAGRVVTLEERIDGCFARSMNGTPPAHDSPEMRALVAYMTFLSKDVPKGSEVEGRGFRHLVRPPTIDPEAGAEEYAARCASCHGPDGAGRRNTDGSYLYPPLWGDRSFNVGAGMARLDTAAAFVHANMPFGNPELTAWETYDIAAYFTEQPRPDFAKKAGDWPKGQKPPDARY